MNKPKRGLRGFLARNFNFSEWIGKDFLLKGMYDIYELFYLLTKPRQEGRKETFAEAVVRLGLSEKISMHSENTIELPRLYTARLLSLVYYMPLGCFLWKKTC